MHGGPEGEATRYVDAFQNERPTKALEVKSMSVKPMRKRYIPRE